METLQALLRTAIATEEKPGILAAIDNKIVVLLCYLTDVSVGDLDFAEVRVTSDGWLIARATGDVGCNEVLNLTKQDLRRLLVELCDALQAPPDDRDALLAQVERRI